MPQLKQRKQKETEKKIKENQDNAAARPCIMQREIEKSEEKKDGKTR